MSDLPRILLVEDDYPMALGLEFNLRAEGFDVVHCPDGESGLETSLKGGFVLVVLDMLMPGISGMEVLKGLRQRDQKTPVLILSATAVSDVIIEALDQGADDYMTKPFELEMLLARIRSLLRARQWLSSPSNESNNPDRAVIGSRTVDFRNSTVSGPDGTVELSFKEGLLLRHLILSAGRTVGRDELLRDVWGYSDGIQTRTIDNFIVALRKKIEANPRKPQFIQTVPGEGYRFMGDEN